MQLIITSSSTAVFCYPWGEEEDDDDDDDEYEFDYNDGTINYDVYPGFPLILPCDNTSSVNT